MNSVFSRCLWSYHPSASSRTLNSSFQRLDDLVLWHQSSKTPSSVMWLWKRTGTKSSSSVVVFGQGGFQRVGFGQLVSVQRVEQVAGLVGFADGGAEEAEGGRLADDEAEFAAGNVDARAFLHAEGDDAEGLAAGARRRGWRGRRSRCRRSTSGRCRRGCGRRLLLGPAVVRRAAGDGVIEVVLAREDLAGESAALERHGGRSLGLSGTFAAIVRPP